MPNRNAKQISAPTPDVAFGIETSLRDKSGEQVDPAVGSAPSSNPRRVKAVGSDPAKVNENAITVAPGATKGNTGA